MFISMMNTEYHRLVDIKPEASYERAGALLIYRLIREMAKIRRWNYYYYYYFQTTNSLFVNPCTVSLHF